MSMVARDCLFLADVDISTNSNTFNFWIAEYEYINKLEYECIFSKLKESLKSIVTCWEYLFDQNPYESIYGLESEYISFFAKEYEYIYVNPKSVNCWHTYTQNL